jgi:hypothetical protein
MHADVRTHSERLVREINQFLTTRSAREYNSDLFLENEVEAKLKSKRHPDGA